MTGDGRPATVGVVLPVFEGAALLTGAVRSVLAQDHHDLALIVVDDGSRDGSTSVARGLAAADPRIRVITLERNRGVAAARNTGVAALDCDLLAFIDQDDRWTPDRLRRGRAALRSDPTLGFVTARQRFIPTDGPTPRWVRAGSLDRDLPGNVLGTVLCRRAVWDDLGGLDETLGRGFDDVDWFARARRRGVPTRELPEVLLLRGLHDANASARVDGVREELLAVVRRHARERPVGGPT